MDPLSWTGQIAFLTPLLTLVFGLLGLSILIWIVLNAVLPENRAINNNGGSLSLSSGPRDIASLAVKLSFLAATALIFSYLVLGLIFAHRPVSSAPWRGSSCPFGSLWFCFSPCRYISKDGSGSMASCLTAPLA